MVKPSFKIYKFKIVLFLIGTPCIVVWNHPHIGIKKRLRGGKSKERIKARKREIKEREEKQDLKT